MHKNFAKENYLKSNIVRAFGWGLVLLTIVSIACFLGDLYICREESICPFVMVSAIKANLLTFGIVSFATGVIIALKKGNENDIRS